MSSKYEPMKKEIPIHGREGIIRSGAVLEQDFFDWDSFSVRYCLIDGCGMIPEETGKLHTHDYDQVLWFLSADPDDMLHLGAEVEIDLGEECVRQRFATPHAITLPKGTPHFSPIVKNLDRPFFFLSVNCTGKMAAEEAAGSVLPESGPWAGFFGKFFMNVHALNFAATDPYHYGSEHQQPLGGYSTFLGSTNNNIKLTMAWSSVCKPGFLGPWGPDGKHHAHAHPDYNEALIFFSTDLDDLSELHGEADFCCGPDGEEQEHFLLTKATAMALKTNAAHLPLEFLKVDKPIIFVTLSAH
ncbi:MAG: hypothetical protein J5827_02625 [Oscillospiraceae bacterium]|nr:hypothetical protein [Oscillospiraceae bacterium]